MTNKNNTYYIKSIEEILNIVNSRNKECFLKDFDNWLTLNIMLKEKIGKFDKFAKIENPKEFCWIDDGINNIKLGFEIKQIEEEKMREKKEEMGQ